MTTPNHTENTGDNLRHAAELQEQARGDQNQTRVPAQPEPDNPPPDFNT